MKYMKLRGCLLGAMALAGVGAGAAERVFPLNLVTQHEPTDSVTVEAVGANEYEWSLSNGLQQTLNIDLRRLGVDPHDYDELRFDIRPLGSQVALHALVFSMPTEKELCSWYLKFRTLLNLWTTGRFDLRVDDDGGLYPERFPGFRAGVLRLELNRRMLGYPGEPQWRKAVFRNPRLIRWVVAADFEPRDVKITANDAEVSYTFGLRVKNRTDKPVAATIEADPEHTLKSFRAEPAGTLTVDLTAGEEKTIPIRLWISAKQAKELRPGYAEPACPKVWVAGVADSEVQPWIGYRKMPMWAVVPVSRPPWAPAMFQERVAAAAKIMPVDGWKKDVLRRVDETLKYDFPAYDWWPTPGTRPRSAPHWGNSYRCPACKGDMRQETPNDIHHHVCRQCGKKFENDAFLDQCARQEYFADRFADARRLAVAWLLTGDSKYADKAIAIMLAYADAHPTMSITDYRSTAGGSRLGYNTLVVTWCLPNLAEGYALLASYPGLDAEKRKRIETLLIDEGLRVARHGCEFNNQQAEHIRTYGSVALATGYWPLLGEAVSGDFGWHAMIEYAYSEDGIGHEGQAYHYAQWAAMNNFAFFAADRGLDLMTPRFKRVYDASLSLGMDAGYELAYRQYHEPAYLVRLEATRKHPGEQSILYGVLDLPKATDVPMASKLMDGMGYIFLRRGTAADFSEIRLNYKEQFDRGEHDRYTTFFYRNGRQVDSCIGRCRYSDPGARFMADTAAHNTIVINGQDSRDVTGDLLVWQGDGPTPLAVVATDPKATLYEGVRQLRGIALLGDAYVVFDRVVCDGPRTIDRYQYGQGKAALAFKTEPPAAPLPKLPERGRFIEVVSGPAGKELRIDFGNDLKMRLVCDRDMTGGKARTHGGYQQMMMDVTWARVDNAREATFLATFSLGKEADPPAATIVKCTDDEIVLEIKAKDRAWAITVRPKDKKAEVVAR